MLLLNSWILPILSDEFIFILALPDYLWFCKFWYILQGFTTSHFTKCVSTCLHCKNHFYVAFPVILNFIVFKFDLMNLKWCFPTTKKKEEELYLIFIHYLVSLCLKDGSCVGSLFASQALLLHHLHQGWRNGFKVRSSQ